MSLENFAKVVWCDVPAYAKPLFDALQLGRVIRMPTYSEQREAQRRALAARMAEFRKMVAK